MGGAIVVGSGIPVLGALGADEPYRLALFVLGVLISAAALGGIAMVLRDQRTAGRNSAQQRS